MGVRQLEGFMKKTVPGGVKKVSLKDICVQYKQEHNELPILVFDFLGFVGWLTNNEEETLCGGRFNKYREVFEGLLKELSKYAKLVFFEDGSVGDVKLPTWIKRHSAKYHECIAIMEKVYNGRSLRSVVDEANGNFNTEIPRVTTQTEMMEAMARKYGELKMTYDRECDSEIARYAYKNERVIAVVANDTDFLIFPGHWRYLSIKDINSSTLETVEYSRQALRTHLNLNTGGLVVLSTLNGNDIIKFEKARDTFHITLHSFKHKFADFRFPELANYARYISTLPSEQRIREMVKLLGCDRKMVEDSLEMYSPVFDLAEPSNDELFEFCNENAFWFVYAVSNKTPIHFTCSYIDLSKHDIFNFKVELFRKQVGIILAHMPEIRDRNYEIVTKKMHAEDYRSHFVKPEILEDVPPILELLDREKFEEHDEARYKLLRYMIGIKNLGKHDFSTFPTNYLQDILTLVVLRHRRFITKFEANLIMLTIKHVEEETVPDDLEPPQRLDEKAFRTSFLFSKFHMYLDRCLKVSGLSHLTKLLNFDGVHFHHLYLNHVDSEKTIRQMLGETLEQYCIYE